MKLFKIKYTITFFLIFYCSTFLISYASDFIVPNSGNDPVVIDISSLNQLQDIDVTIGDFSDQPRPYRDSGTSSLVIFPPPTSSSEKTITVRAGGTSLSKTISFRSIPDGELKTSLLPDINTGRGGNTVTKLSDGRIVLIGGSKNLVDGPINSIEIFDPETGKIDFLTSDGTIKTMLLSPRSQHTATYIGLNNSPLGMVSGPVEQIVIIGGFSRNGVVQRRIEILEIQTGTTIARSTSLKGKKSRLDKARLFHTANLLPDGRILIAGGQGKINETDFGALDSIEIFNPSTRKMESSNIMLNTPRQLHTATTLQSGDILIAGGFTNESESMFGIGPGTSTSELIDSANLSIKEVGDLSDEEGIGGHSATLLTNGLVFFTGGSSSFFSDTDSEFDGLTTKTIQIFNPANETFSLVKDSDTGVNLELQTSRFLHSAVLLPTGDIAIIGGLNIVNESNSSSVISTPVSDIEVIRPDLSSFTSTLNAELKSVINTHTGRIQPTAILITPQEKTKGFLSNSHKNTFVNAAVFLTGGFTNDLGELPTKSSELIQINSVIGAEGRRIITSPDGEIKGGYIMDFQVTLDTFSEIPALKITPQTVNLSISNEFMTNIMIDSTNGNKVLLMADSNASITLTPSTFQSGDTVTISRNNSSVSGEFDLTFSPVNSTDDFVPAKLKINVSDSGKAFLATTPDSGISLSTASGSNSQNISLRVLSQDGSITLTTVPSSTQVTATIADSTIANVGGFSSVVGDLNTNFTINALMAGSTEVTFSINFPDILSVTLPIRVSGIPSFSDTPINQTDLTNLELAGAELTSLTKLNPTTLSFEDLRISPSGSCFPIYVPVNLTNSTNTSLVNGLFTVRPLFGLDLFSSRARTLLNNDGDDFSNSETEIQSAIGGFGNEDNLNGNPIAVLAYGDGIRTINFSNDVSENITQNLERINMIDGIQDLKVFSVSGEPKIVAIKSDMLLIINASTGEQESSTLLSGNGSEIYLTEIENSPSAVVAVSAQGVDLIQDLDKAEPRLINFQIDGSTKNITVVEKLNSVSGPFVIAFDDTNTFSIVNLIDVTVPPQKIIIQDDNISKIDFAGRFTVSGMAVDVLAVTSGKQLLLLDLTSGKLLTLQKELKIKSRIEDMVVIDGIIYLALGGGGILALRTASLLNPNAELEPEIITFTENKITVEKNNGNQETKTKKLSCDMLSKAEPFLLCSGSMNDLSVIKAIP